MEIAGLTPRDSDLRTLSRRRNVYFQQFPFKTTALAFNSGCRTKTPGKLDKNLISILAKEVL
jgi:hypothetical protein